LIEHEQLSMVDTLSMNDIHFDTILLINKLSTAILSADVNKVNAIFEELIQHTIEHSKEEEDMMIAKKFPPYLAHKQEHDIALADMKKVASTFKEREDFDEARHYIEVNLTPWFLQHTETMDAVTSMFLENSEVHLEYWDRLKPRTKPADD
jgi:hemerythrin